MAIASDTRSRGADARHIPTPALPHRRVRPALKFVQLPWSIVAACHDKLVCHSILLLRMSMGLVIFGFGFMKYFPGVSPAQDLVTATTGILTFGLIPPNVTLILTATLESIIGLSLITGL